MSSRRLAAAAGVSLLGGAGFVVGLLASGEVAIALSLALTTVAVAVLGAVVILVHRLRHAFQRYDERALAQENERRAQARMLLQRQRRSAKATDRLLRKVGHVESASARTKEQLTRLEGAITAVQRDVAALHRPPPRPAPLTGQDLTTAGTRALAALEFDGAAPCVVLLLQSFGAKVMFAGIRTAAMAAIELAGRLSRPLRVVVFEELVGDPAEAIDVLRALIRAESPYPELADTLRLNAPASPDPRGHHPDDVWMATFWTTAWNVSKLVEQQQVRADNVVYLVQDWEPGFYPWGDLKQKVLTTYEAGFRLLVNSRSLARYVAHRTGEAVDPATVFAPELDVEPLRAAAGGWHPSPDGSLRVLFYARPSKPRNMLNLGLQALQAWSRSMPDEPDVVVRLAGEPLGEVDLGPRLRTEVLGKLSYDDYYDLLADTDIGLALMSSPHPGHLSLELPMAGIPTVTNPFDGYRESWVDGLIVAERADADALADALSAAAKRAAGLESHHAVESVRDLGGTLAEAVAAVSDMLRASER